MTFSARLVGGNKSRNDNKKFVYNFKKKTHNSLHGNGHHIPKYLSFFVNFHYHLLPFSRWFRVVMEIHEEKHMFWDGVELLSITYKLITNSVVYDRLPNGLFNITLILSWQMV